jgi:GT2 family glycosyltransferase
MAVRKDAAIAVGGPDAKARYYRNADLEFSLMLREAGGRLVVPSAHLPCRQGRHHGYHDTDPGYRKRESRRNYERLLRRFRGRTDLLAPR